MQFSKAPRETQERIKQVYTLLLDAQKPEEGERVISLPQLSLVS